MTETCKYYHNTKCKSCETGGKTNTVADSNAQLVRAKWDKFCNQRIKLLWTFLLNSDAFISLNSQSVSDLLSYSIRTWIKYFCLGYMFYSKMRFLLFDTDEEYK